jgi:putative nucleotidyltransferase with HDIG domain
MTALLDVKESDLFPIHLAVMQPGTLAPVDLYMRAGAGGDFTLYKAAHMPLTAETRDRLLTRGTEVLYIHKKDQEAYQDYVEENLIAIVRDDLIPYRDACRIVYDSSARVVHDVFDDPRSGRNLKRAETMVEGVVISILKSPGALWEILSLASHDYYTYTHSVQVSVLLVGASRELLDVSDADLLKRIGHGGMLHDIGKTRISNDILYKPGPLTDEEFEVIKQHPLMGLELVERHRKLPATSAAIVRSHHERYDGQGYPDGVPGDRMRPVARLSKIVDVYDALTTERAYAPARAPYEALKLMKQLEGQFDAGLLDGFIQFLGPNPPRR